MRKTISKKELLALIQEFAAIDSVSTSAVRGQPRKTKKVIQEYLATVRLGRIPHRTRHDFEAWLDRQTEHIQHGLAGREKPWGIARKTLNLFLRLCFYIHYLRREYGLAKVGRWLEVPLDGLVARELRKDAGRGVLPRWKGLKRLKQEDSERYQEHAREYAAACKLPVPVFLDNYLWLRGRRRRPAH